MRVAVVGAGGLGGCLGGLLAYAGEEVSLIARGANMEAIQANGLTVKSIPFGEFNISLTAAEDPAEIGHVDLALFCVKTYDTDTAVKLLQPLVGNNTTVLSVQNGVESASRIADVIGYEHVIGAMSQVGGHVESPGVVAQHINIGLDIGELEGGTSQRIEEIAKTFERAGVPTIVRPDILSAIWEKFAAFVAIVGVEALTRLPAGIIRARSETRELVEGILGEILAVADAAGVSLRRDLTDYILGILDSFPPTHMGSMGVDLLAGKHLELDSIHGAMVRLGKEHGVPTPLSFAVYAALKPYAEGASGLP